MFQIDCDLFPLPLNHCRLVIAAVFRGNMFKLIIFEIALIIIALGGAGPAWSQAAAHDPQAPKMEEHLRRQLRKIEGWGIKQLLRTERDVDWRQKQRATTSTNPDELALLAEDEDSGVRFHVAANPHTPLDVLLVLADDPVSYVRSGVAMTVELDPLAPATVQQLTETLAQKLAKDPSPLVRLSLVENKKLPPTVFDFLARDPDFIIRQRLAKNLSISQNVLTLLAQDSVQSVQIHALQHRNIPPSWLEKMATHPSGQIRQAVCQNINAPLKVLSRLSTDFDPAVRLAVAHHPRTPVETLKLMTGDADAAVVVAIANHAKADRDILMQLAYDDRDPVIRIAAQQRLTPLLRREIREDILERWERK